MAISFCEVAIFIMAFYSYFSILVCVSRERCICRFLRSLESNIKSDTDSITKSTARVFSFDVANLWCRERGVSGRSNFYADMFLHHDVYHQFGSYPVQDVEHLQCPCNSIRFRAKSMAQRVNYACAW